ncbi:MAG: hypothetical protein RLZ28_1112, partial [Actinomycetota bacterium]
SANVTLAAARVKASKVFVENLVARQRQVNGLLHLNGNGFEHPVIPTLLTENNGCQSAANKSTLIACAMSA